MVELQERPLSYPQTAHRRGFQERLHDLTTTVRNWVTKGQPPARPVHEAVTQPKKETEPPAWQKEVQERTPKWKSQSALSWGEIMTPIYSVEGRNTRESNDPEVNIPEAQHMVDTLRLKGDFRDGWEGNVSAMEVIRQEFKTILSLVAYLRSVIYPHDRSHPYGSNHPDAIRMKMDGILDTLGVAAMLPNFLVLRAKNPMENGKVPSAIVALVGVARGMSTPMQQAKMRELADGIWKNHTLPRESVVAEQNPAQAEEQEEPVKHVKSSAFLNNAEAFVEYVFGGEEYFLKPDTKVTCPAPRPMIKRVAEALLEPPKPGMIDEGKNLLAQCGVSERDINLWLRGLGSARNKTERYRNVWKVIDRVLDPEQNIIHDRDNTKRFIQREFVAEMNSCLKTANAALGRNMPPVLTDKDLPAQQ